MLQSAPAASFNLKLGSASGFLSLTAEVHFFAMRAAELDMGVRIVVAPRYFIRLLKLLWFLFLSNFFNFLHLLPDLLLYLSKQLYPVSCRGASKQRPLQLTIPVKYSNMPWWYTKRIGGRHFGTDVTIDKTGIHKSGIWLRFGSFNCFKS